ncbi:AMP-binding protein [Frankia sp. AgB1.9]|uniref:class I adenylate-forming enzyme family protein n=1 Tax=unclassified Frankia TaxID=2632575 RepID=UPI001933EAEF|nr:MULTISPECIES: AMP-binding protein [unclassified Frankia]MBL7486824.1 AMP-binding protein [Frankia sp. AgW1.1]MBL7549803.1 AMP-binding protein [Frankia sp. AgB1.9]MBL7622887.1 AMP-binding protein [Frankia sp. AgB1.8]
MTVTVGVPIGQRLSDLAAADPDRLSVVVVRQDGGREALDRQQVEDGANRWGRALAARGLAAGDRVALLVHNSVELVLGALGAWKVGAVPVPVRWDLPAWERERVLAVVAARVVIDEGTAPALRAEAATFPADPLPAVTPQHSFGICSSGSTGTPKVIVNTRPGRWTAELSTPFAENFGGPVTHPQVVLVPAPMYHTNGFMTLNSLLGGDRLVILEKFDAVAAIDAIEREGVTTFTATPTMLQRLAAVPGIDGRDLSRVEWILQGAAMMPPALLRRWFDLLAPEKVIMAYGMTEQLGLVAIRGDEWLTHPGSVGRGFRGTELRILDEYQNPVPAGVYGDVYLRSPATGAYDYLGGAPLLPTTPDGFGTAGDMGHLDEEGYLYLADRRVDMIITGGANVFPAEVEGALSEHPDIADVVVVGLSDPDWGRRVHAIVERRPGTAGPSEQECIAFVKARLASYKAPKSVEFVAELPRSAATKISRSALVAERGG